MTNWFFPPSPTAYALYAAAFYAWEPMRRVPDLFFDLFARRLREKSGVFAPILADPLAEIIGGERVWSAVDRVAPPNASAVAVDGGGVQAAGLSDGRQLVVARAIAISSAGSAPVRDVDLDVVPPGRRGGWGGEHDD